MAVCDLAPLIKGEISEKTIIELEKELAPFHEVAYQSKVWEALMEEARKCSTEFVTKILLSNDILQLMQQRLGVSPKEPACHKLLHYKLVDMLEDETPVKVSRTKNSSAA